MSSKMVNNQHHDHIIEVNYYLSIYNVQVELTLSTE